MPADLSNHLRQLVATAEVPALGPGPRPAIRTESNLEAELKSVFAEAPLSDPSRELIRALVLLWHDHLDASHAISQAIENPDGSLVHAIMHRREPDYWNSKYWWRRVGKHPCFPEIARRVSDLLKSKGEDDLAAKLVPGGKWDAFAFVDACEAVAGLPALDKRVQLLQQIQQIEFEAVLRYFLES